MSSCKSSVIERPCTSLSTSSGSPFTLCFNVQLQTTPPSGQKRWEMQRMCRQASPPGRHLWTTTDSVCEMWRTCPVSASNMRPVISLTVPVIATAAHQAALSVLLWAFGSSDCWSEGFIIFPLIAECSLWVKFNTAIQLPRNVLTNLHLKHFPMESKQRQFVWDVTETVGKYISLMRFGWASVLERWNGSHSMSHSGWDHQPNSLKNKNEKMACLVLVMLQRLIFHFLRGRCTTRELIVKCDRKVVRHADVQW